MKQLTIEQNFRIIGNYSDLEVFESNNSVNIPTELKQIILNYEGCVVEECVFKTNLSDPEFVVISRFLNLVANNSGTASIEEMFQGLKSDEIVDFLPFAIDQGGWGICIGIGSKYYGQIWIDQFDSGEAEPFKFVSNNLETFINGLMTREVAVNFGY